MAWTDDKRARLDRLKGAEARGALFDDERAELAALLCELDREEAAALASTFARQDETITRLKQDSAAAHETLATLERIATAQRELRDEAREYLMRLRARRLALAEQARVATQRTGTSR